MLSLEKKIKLPRDGNIREKLSHKYVEYKSRINQHITEDYEGLVSELNFNKVLNTKDPKFQDAYCKSFILEYLITNKKVSPSAIRKQLNQKVDNMRSDRIDNAIFVIRDYCNTGGKKVSGGTGF
ncbi:hypothetical protein ACFL1H_03780 [Nanoarchaeota archaeon]